MPPTQRIREAFLCPGRENTVIRYNLYGEFIGEMPLKIINRQV